MPEDASPPLELSPVTALEAGTRLDAFLSSRLASPRAQASRLVREGRVAIAGRAAVRPAQPIRPGDLITVLAGAAPRGLDPSLPGPRVVYQDELVAVVDKPAGLVVHPGPGHQVGTLAQLIQGWGGEWSQAAGADRPGIVHRLDRGTSGLLVLARTDAAHHSLARQLRTRSMGREYWGLVEGDFVEDRGRIEAALGRDPRRPRRMAVGPGGRQATTEFQVLERWPGSSALRLRLGSGRTHQIRVHLAYIGRPLVGDSVYGKRGDERTLRPALHAAMLHFRHPGDGRELTFISPLPEDLERLRLEVGAAPGTRATWPWEALPSGPV